MSGIIRPVPSRVSTIVWMGLPALALLAGIGFFVTFALPYLLMDAEVLGRFEGRRAWIISHIAAGSVALFTGPFQLWMGATGKAMKLHRKLGMIYLARIAPSSLTAFHPKLLSYSFMLAITFGLARAFLHATSV